MQMRHIKYMSQSVAVYWNALQCAAVCRSVLHRKPWHAYKCCILPICNSVLRCVAVCCSVLQCVAVRCSVLQCVAVC